LQFLAGEVGRLDRLGLDWKRRPPVLEHGELLAKVLAAHEGIDVVITEVRLVLRRDIEREAAESGRRAGPSRRARIARSLP